MPLPPTSPSPVPPSSPLTIPTTTTPSSSFAFRPRRAARGAGLASLVETYSAAYLGSIANTLDHLRGIGPIADVVAEGNADDWLNYPGPLLDAYRIFNIGLGPADTSFCDLPKVRSIATLKGDDGALDLIIILAALLHMLKLKQLSRVLLFKRGLTVSSSPMSRSTCQCARACKGLRWLRCDRLAPCPPHKGHQLHRSTQYLVAFCLTFGLPIKTIGRSTTCCVRTCALAASTRTSEPVAVADFSAWRFGDHFFHCSAGSKLDGVTNCLGRHNNVSAILVALLLEEFGYICCSTQRVARPLASPTRSASTLALRVFLATSYPVPSTSLFSTPFAPPTSTMPSLLVPTFSPSLAMPTRRSRSMAPTLALPASS